MSILGLSGGGCSRSTATTGTSQTNVAASDREEPGGQPSAAHELSGRQLYAAHCRVCHGENGDGFGTAAGNLYPRPRNLRKQRFRLISSRNGVPTLSDIESVLLQGMPGSSMKSFANLSSRDRRVLAEEVLRLRGDGIRERVIKELADESSEIDDVVIDRLVEFRTAPDEIVEAPPMGDPDPAAIARGKAIYLKQNCHTCHGFDGVGRWDVNLLDDNGLPTRPRDLVNEHFKGGHDSASIYLRVLLGMPGAEMPSGVNLTSDQLVDLVQFVRSLSREPKVRLTDYQRSMQATSRAYLTALGRSPAS